MHSALLLSLDSFIATLAVGPLIKSRSTRIYLAFWFGFWDGAATLIGATFGWGRWGDEFSHWVVPLAALFYGISCVLAATWIGFRASPRLAFVLPFLMSFDNLAYGASIGPMAASQVVERALTLGMASFLMAILGLLPWGGVRFASERARQYSSGFALFAASVVLFVA